MMKKLFTLLLATVATVSAWAQIEQGKTYIIQCHKNSGTFYMQDNGAGLVINGGITSTSYWTFTPTGTANCYYVQNASTGRYIQSTNLELRSPVQLGTTPVEMVVWKDTDASHTNTVGMYAIASNDQTTIDFSGTVTKGCNCAEANMRVEAFGCKAGTNAKSFWTIFQQDMPTPVTLSSPFTGTTVAEGDFYLYNVESGLWLQNNDSRTNFWHTLGDLGTRGLDFTLTANGEGYYICGKLTTNNTGATINRSNMYLDTNASDVWTFEPITVNGITNAYKIYSDDFTLCCNKMTATFPAYGLFSKGGGDQYYLGSASNPDAEHAVWQIITKQERLAKLAEATENNPLDASWLVPTADFPNNDSRYDLWTKEFNGGEFGRGHDVDGNLGRGSMIISGINTDYANMYTTITVPNGRYTLQPQGFYRDGSHNEIGAKRDAGDEMLRAVYYANNVQQNVMSICDQTPNAQVGNYYAWQSGNYWIPDNSDRPAAQRCLQLGMPDGYGYVNDPIEVIVRDGQLTIGVKKGSKSEGDWLVFDNFKLTYYGPVTYQTTQENINLTNGYATYCSDRDMQVTTTGADAYKVSATSEADGTTNAVLTKIDYIPAYTGVIIFGEGLTAATLESVETITTPVDVSDNLLRSSIVAHQLMAEEFYGNQQLYNYTLGVSGNNVSFKHSSGYGKLAAGRAYLQTPINVIADGGGAKIMITFDDATGIDILKNEQLDKTSDAVYDLQGRRMTGILKQGIYIVNGKKYIIK